MPNDGKKLSKWLWAVIIIAAISFLAGLALLITDFFIPVKYLSAYCVAVNKNKEGVLRVSFIDVGLGDCTVVELPDGKTLVIDGGDGTHANNVKILSALNSRGIDTVDYLFCTSPAKERCGGLSEIITYKKVKRVFAPSLPVTYINDGFRNFSNALKRAGITPEDISYGAGVFNDVYGYNFCTLSPSPRTLDGGEYSDMLLNPTEANINNASAVVWLEYNGTGFLLLGSISAEVQDRLFNESAGAFEVNGRTVDVSRCAVLKVPNHGAEISAYDIYGIASPQIAVISVGGNGKGCPSPMALTLAQNHAGEKLYRTDVDGTVTVTVENFELKVEKERR